MKSELFILVLAALLRLAAVLALGEEGYPDSDQFLDIARNVVAGRGFMYNGSYDHTRPPGYPSFLALVFGLGGGIRAVQLAQVGLDTLATWLLMRLALALGLSARAALAAGLLWAVNPYALQFTRLVLSECLAGALFLGTLWAWAELVARPRLGAAFGTGALFALGALVRASAIGAAGLGAAVIAARGEGPRAVRLAAAVALMAGMGLTLAPWTARNYALWGEPVLVAPLGGMTLYDSFNEYADGGVRTVTEGLEWPKGRTIVETDRLCRDLALNWARANPERAAWLSVEKQKRFWSPIPNNEKFRRMPFLLAGVYEVPLFLLALIGAVMAVRERSRAALLLPIVLYFPALHTVYLGSLRYRMPIEPLLALFAAIPLAASISSTRRTAS
jgi:hypothetical protein